MIRIDSELLDKYSNLAAKNKRRRINHNFHHHPEAMFQRMLNAMEPDTYIRPHKHEKPDKTEVFIAMKGKMAVISFHDNGDILEVALLNNDSDCRGVEIPPSTWHTIISLESGSVAWEAKDGPYDPNVDKKFADWAPEEGGEYAAEYLEKLRKKIETLSD